VTAGQKNTDDESSRAAGPPPVHTDPSIDDEEAWEGFALDASVFRSGGDHRDE
jgi:hypothetical protein